MPRIDWYLLRHTPQSSKWGCQGRIDIFLSTRNSTTVPLIPLMRYSCIVLLPEFCCKSNSRRSSFFRILNTFKKKTKDNYVGRANRSRLKGQFKISIMEFLNFSYLMIKTQRNLNTKEELTPTVPQSDLNLLA